MGQLTSSILAWSSERKLCRYDRAGKGAKTKVYAVLREKYAPAVFDSAHAAW